RREVARVRHPVRRRDWTAAAQPGGRRRALAGLPGHPGRPGVPLHARPDARIGVHAGFEGPHHGLQRQDHAGGHRLRAGERDPVHGARGAEPRPAGPLRQPGRHGPGAGPPDPQRQPLARRPSGGIQRAQQGRPRRRGHYGLGYERAWSPRAGGETTRITPLGNVGRRHFGRDPNRIFIYDAGDGLVSMRYDGTDRRAYLKVTGYTYPGPGAEPDPADEILVAPDTDRVPAQEGNNGYLVTRPQAGGETPRHNSPD